MKRLYEILSFISSKDLTERLNGCDGILCTLMQKIGSDVILYNAYNV